MRISATNVRKADGTKLINGYKLALQKSEVERIGMSEGTELVPRFEDGKITLIEAGRLIPENQTKGILYCACYRKIADNAYTPDTIMIAAGEAIAKEILQKYEDRPLPHELVQLKKDGTPAAIIWKGAKCLAKKK